MTVSGHHDLDAIAPLRTQRLILRVPVAADLPALTAFVTGSDRMDALGGRGRPVDAWRNHRANMGRWLLDGYGFFTVLRGNEPVGRVGLLSYPTGPVELAWHLYDGFEGQGFATEAARAVLAWAREDRGLTDLASFIDPANARSQAVARRLGARDIGRTPDHTPDCSVWEHPA